MNERPKIHHMHVYCEQPTRDRYSLGDFSLGSSGQMVRLMCYQNDCYAVGGPHLSRSLYPPELIGPKLIVLEDKVQENGVLTYQPHNPHD